MAKKPNVVRDWDVLVPQILDDLNKGRRLTTVAKEIGVSTERIRQVFKARGEVLPAQRPLPLGKRPSKHVLLQREHDIIRERTVDGLSLEEIGAKHGITRERVRQILVAAGHLEHTDAASEAKAVRTAREQAQLHTRLVQLLSEDPSLTRAQLAEAADIPADEVSKLLGTSVWMLSEEQSTTVFYETEEMLSCIRRAAYAKDVTEISGRMYDQWRSETSNKALPASQAIIRRFGSWTDAVTAAGLEPITARRSNYRRITWDEATSAVAAFIVAARKVDPYTRATSAEYEGYAQNPDHGVPSIAGLRLYWSWRDVRVGAVTKVVARLAKERELRTAKSTEKIG